MVSVESVVFQEKDFKTAVFEINGSDMDKVFTLHLILPNPTIIAPNQKWEIYGYAHLSSHNWKGVRKSIIDLKEPPKGCHSVHGKSKSLFFKSVLNYDEIVIFNPNGACPRYVLLYS